MKQNQTCYFCGEQQNIIITSLINKETKVKEPICHVCFNQAARCDSGLMVNGIRTMITLPRSVYTIIYKKY